jgi:multiple sugar transport system substrate-binding protein
MKRFSHVLAALLVGILLISVPASAVEASTLQNVINQARRLFGRTEDGKRRTNITYMFWGNPTEAIATQGVANEFNASQDQIFVEVMQTPQETMIERLNTMAMARRLPDTAIMDERGVIQWAEKGLLADISDMYGPDDPKPMDSLAFTYRGNTVAYSSCNVFLVMFYNKALFDEAGIPYPPKNAEDAWTWEQFVNVAKRLTKDSNGNTPNDAGFNRNNIVQYGAAVETWTWQLDIWTRSNGGGFVNSRGTRTTIGRQDSMDAIQRVADLHLVHNVAPLNPGIEDNVSSQAFLNGNIAMATGGTWSIGAWLNGAEDLEYGVAVLPKMRTPVTLNAGGPQVVFNQSRNLPEAKEWIKWYTQIENNWSLVELGIWCPPLENYYTDDAMIRSWIDSDAYPGTFDETKSVMVDYYKDYAQPAAFYFTNNYRDFELLLRSVLGDVWTGQTTAREAITGNLRALEATLSGN